VCYRRNQRSGSKDTITTPFSFSPTASSASPDIIQQIRYSQKDDDTPEKDEHSEWSKPEHGGKVEYFDEDKHGKTMSKSSSSARRLFTEEKKKDGTLIWDDFFRPEPLNNSPTGSPLYEEDEDEGNSNTSKAIPVRAPLDILRELDADPNVVNNTTTSPEHRESNEQLFGRAVDPLGGLNRPLSRDGQQKIADTDLDAVDLDDLDDLITTATPMLRIPIPPPPSAKPPSSSSLLLSSSSSKSKRDKSGGSKKRRTLWASTQQSNSATNVDEFDLTASQLQSSTRA